MVYKKLFVKSPGSQTLAVLALGLISLCLLIYSHYSWRNVFQTHMSILFNIGQVQENAYTGYLRLKEIAKRGGDMRMEEIEKLFNKAAQAEEDSVTGKSHMYGLTAAPLNDDPELLRQLELTRDSILQCLQLIREWRDNGKMGISETAIPISVDRSFENIHRNAALTDKYLNRHIVGEMATLDRVLVLTVVLWLVILASVCSLLFHTAKKQKQAGKELEMSEQKAHAVIKTVGDGIVVMGADSRIRSTNRELCNIFGYPEEELIGARIDRLIPEKFRTAHSAGMQRYLKTTQPRVLGRRIQLEGLRKDGSVFPLEMRIEETKAGGDRFFTAAIQDISERKQDADKIAKYVEDLKRSNQELQQFAYVASHDLQEPLRMVASYTKLLECRYKGRLDSKADKFIAYAVDGATRMQDLINALLTYARVETQGKPPEPADCAGAYGAAIANLQETIRESGALLTNDDLPSVMADSQQLCQLFQNLIGNAIKFRNEGLPIVHTSAKRNGEGWVFSVRDNGIGMESANDRRIFLIFNRLHGYGEYSGTGIGLAVCKRIVERHGGKIWVESQPGNGSTFYFTLRAPELGNENKGKGTGIQESFFTDPRSLDPGSLQLPTKEGETTWLMK